MQKHGDRPWLMALSGGIPKEKRSGEGVVPIFSCTGSIKVQIHYQAL